jgi:hypothetical protein
MSDDLFELEDDAPAAKKSSAKAETAPSVLDQLKDVLSKKIERPEVFVEVPERPGVTIRVSPNITQHQMRAWRKQSGEDSKNGMDATKFAATVVGQTCTGIAFNNEIAEDEQGRPFTFGSKAIMEMVGATRPIPDAVINFFGIEPHVESAALAILDAAGFSDTVEAVDPTKIS